MVSDGFDHAGKTKRRSDFVFRQQLRWRNIAGHALLATEQLCRQTIGCVCLCQRSITYPLLVEVTMSVMPPLWLIFLPPRH